MTMSTKPGNADQDRGRRISARLREEMQSRIDALVAGSDKKFLTDDARLRAALFISRLYSQAKAHGHRPKLIESHCGAVAQAGEDFRIHRWMLRQSETEITPELKQRYAGKAEPARKVRLYLRLVAGLAELLAKEPFVLQQEFLAVTGLNSRPLPRDPMLDPAEVQPELRLAHLLRDHAAQMADRLDLARLFQRAERLQAGWSLHDGPVAKLMESEFRFDPKSPPTFVLWLDDEVPPYPSVKVGRIPYGALAGSFSVVPLTDFGAEPSQNREALTLEGSATVYWELYLAIAPNGDMGVGSYLIRNASVDIQLPMGDAGAMITHTLLDAHDDLWGLQPMEVQGKLWGNQFYDGGWWQVHLADATAGAFSADPALWASCYRPERRGGDLEEYPPSHDVPNARITPTTAQNIHDWLVEDLSLPPRLGSAAPIPDPNLYGETTVVTWNRGSSLANWVEAALHNGRLDAAFEDWVVRYSASLGDLERGWFDAAQRDEAALRDRWAVVRLGHDTNSEGIE
jgi:hypothetical protein